MPRAIVFAHRSIGPIYAKTREPFLLVEEQLEYAFVMTVVGNECTPKIPERLPTPFVQNEKRCIERKSIYE